MLVKGFGLVIFGMNRECPNTSDVRRLYRSLHGILEQAAPEAVALPRGCDKEPRQEHDGNRVTDEAFGRQSCGCAEVSQF